MFNDLFNATSLIGMFVALIAGLILKKWPVFPSKFIPIATFVISLLTQFVNALQPAAVPPPAVHAMATVSVVYAFGSFWTGSFFKTLVNALIQTLITTGAHSGTKNVIEGFQTTTGA